MVYSFIQNIQCTRTTYNLQQFHGPGHGPRYGLSYQQADGGKAYVHTYKHS